MCGRYVFWEDEDNEEFQRIVYELHEQYPDLDLKDGEIAPSQKAPVLIGNLNPVLQEWGFPGFKEGQLLINARAETVRQKKTFQESVYRRRCLIPTTGFFEWSPEKKKFLFQAPKGGPLYLAGIYQPEERFVILTTVANSSVSAVHPRMPLIIPENKRQDWLNNTAFAMRYLQGAEPFPPLKSQIYL